MRELARFIRAERGATAVLVAILMVPLIGFAAIGIDVGAMYWENAQLQNGADAAALAVAKKCADLGQASGCTNAAAIATGLAGDNSNDSVSDALVSYPAGCGTNQSGGNYVKVDTTTRTSSGATVLAHPFATALGIAPSTVRASACVRWGYPSQSSPLLPLTISLCSFSPALDGTKQLVQYANPNDRTCPGNSAYPPGGFGWLNDDANCIATIAMNNTTQGAHGNSFPGECSAVMNTMMGKTILVPIFDSVSPGTVCGAASGQNCYHIMGFAAFVITGWRFSGGSNLPQVYTDTAPGAPTCTGSCRGIIGYFSHWATSADVPLGGVNMGALVVSLVG